MRQFGFARGHYRAAPDDEVCELHGDGQQTRSFTYVSDHVDGIIRAIEAPADADSQATADVAPQPAAPAKPEAA